MKIGIYSDPHITKKLHIIDNKWNESILDTFNSMYKKFKDYDVDLVVCGGDFFDKPVLEAKHVFLLSNIMDILSMYKFNTYFLLGNHEIESSDHNILSCLSNYNKVKVIEDLYKEGNLLFIPYSVYLENLDPSIFNDCVIFTHHDIYGSELAGGKVKASFGIDPNIFNKSKIVFNGHLHNRSVLGKVINVGSLFATQFGEIKEGSYSDYPSYYIYDTDKGSLETFNNKDSFAYITIPIQELNNALNSYDKDKLILRVLYNSEEDIKNVNINSLGICNLSYKKIINKDTLDETIVANTTSNIDIKELLSSYIDKDETLDNDSKERIKSKSFDILGG